ncbi:MAG: DUF1127 domain-containing protein [Hyphomicrobiales bacterium]|jgi:uncharacterized protein YjiS (DUF1127 family)
MVSIATRAHPSRTPSFVSPVQLLKRFFANRRTVRALGNLDDRQLADIGLSRLDVEWASLLPVASDAAAELDSLVRQTRRIRREPHELG